MMQVVLWKGGSVSAAESAAKGGMLNAFVWSGHDTNRPRQKHPSPCFKMMLCSDDCKVISAAVRITGFL